MKTLQDSVEGEVIRPEAPNYDEARKIWNGMIDRRPAAIVRCKSPRDIARCLEFARDKGVSITVRGGGHSIPGHSMCDVGLVIDLAELNAVTVEPENRIARVQGGALLGDLDRATRPYGQATPAGAVSHTGVGGLTLGGGFGHLMRKHGLTIDSLLEVEIVLADGSIQRANDRQNQDLFWAVRGGGGNYGVVTEFVFRTHDVHDPLIAMVMHKPDEAAPVLKRWRETMPDAPNELNWCSFFRHAVGVPGIPEEIAGKPVLLSLLEWHGDHAAGRVAIESILREIGGSMQFTTVMPFLHLQTFLDEMSEHGHQVWTKAGFFDTISDEAIEILIGCGQEMKSWRATLEVLPLGGAIDDVPSDATAFPHRSARYVFNIIGIWEDSAEDAEHMRWVRDSYRKLEPFMTGGAYINYMGGEESGGAGAAFGQGSHMARLQQIKKRYDPDNLFSHNFNVAPGAGDRDSGLARGSAGPAS